MSTEIIVAITIGLIIGLPWGMGIMSLNLRYKRRKHMLDVLRRSVVSYHPNLKGIMIASLNKEAP